MGRRKGKLGELLNVAQECYAGRAIGGCVGSLTQEHPLSEALRRGHKLQVVVSRQRPTATKWQRTFSAGVSAKQASALVLCAKHNGALSIVDAEALRLSRALREAGDRSRAILIREHTNVRIDGHRFGRWLCKFYSGAMAMTGQVVHPDFVRYAFGQPTSGRLYFLFPFVVGGRPALGDTSNLPIHSFRSWDGGPEAFRVTFEGVDVVGSTIRDGPEMQEILDELPYPAGTRIIDRLRVLDMQQLRISIDWGTDPDEARILDTTGMPTSSR